MRAGSGDEIGARAAADSGSRARTARAKAVRTLKDFLLSEFESRSGWKKIFFGKAWKKIFFRVEGSRRKIYWRVVVIDFWGWEPVWFSKKKSDRWIEFGLKKFFERQKRVDWFYLDDKGFFIHVKVAGGLCHDDLDDHSFLPLEFYVSGKKKFDMAPIASRNTFLLARLSA